MAILWAACRVLISLKVADAYRREQALSRGGNFERRSSAEYGSGANAGSPPPAASATWSSATRAPRRAAVSR